MKRLTGKEWGEEMGEEEGRVHQEDVGEDRSYHTVITADSVADSRPSQRPVHMHINRLPGRTSTKGHRRLQQSSREVCPNNHP